MIFTSKAFFLFLLIFCSGFINIINSAQIFNCPDNQTKFEKLIGIRPDVTATRALLYKSKNNNPITLECLTQCANDEKCTSFILSYNSSECYSYSNSSLGTQNYDYDSRPDTDVVWFRKTCLKVPGSCASKAWAIEILAGATLIGSNTKKIKEKMSRQRCIELCFQETSFICKSIKFNLITKYMDLSDPDPIGTCTLSNTDRHLTTSAFRVSRYEDEYIENQCIDNSAFHSSDYCSYEEYENTTLYHIDLIFRNITQAQCQNMCDTTLSFNCRGYSIVPLNNKNFIANILTEKINCLIHSEDSKVIGPKLLIERRGAKYYERARCLNVSVMCSNNLMSIKYLPEQNFFGRIYTTGFSNIRPCYADGNGINLIQLNLPLNEKICGITEALTAEPWNRTLKSVLLVIQYNALIQTQSDRLIKVGCVYGSSDDREITLGTTVNFTSSFPNRGSTVVNSSTVLPTVTMKIVDYNTKKPITDTEIGQELEMVIEISPGDGPYDLWAGNLIATSGNNTLQLLDESGCPTYLNIFPTFTNIHTNSSRMLVSNFQAFKFPSNPLVRFSVMVHFCTLNCPPIECVAEDNLHRRKRETDLNGQYQITSDVINATVYKINGKKNTDNSTDNLKEEMPLEIVLHVRGVNISPDQLVYGENNRILIAGYDYVTNEICLDYNLLIGLLVIWVLLQIIIVVCCFLLIRKYKKYFHIAYVRQLDDMHQNFGFGSQNLSRRVRWADQ